MDNLKMHTPKPFNELSTSHVKYHNVDSYQRLLDVIKTL